MPDERPARLPRLTSETPGTDGFRTLFEQQAERLVRSLIPGYNPPGDEINCYVEYDRYSLQYRVVVEWIEERTNGSLRRHVFHPDVAIDGDRLSMSFGTDFEQARQARRDYLNDPQRRALPGIRQDWLAPVVLQPVARSEPPVRTSLKAAVRSAAASLLSPAARPVVLGVETPAADAGPSPVKARPIQIEDRPEEEAAEQIAAPVDPTPLPEGESGGTATDRYNVPYAIPYVGEWPPTPVPLDPEVAVPTEAYHSPTVSLLSRAVWRLIPEPWRLRSDSPPDEHVDWPEPLPESDEPTRGPR